MIQMLGRKQTSKNSDWLYAYTNIEDLISPEEVQAYADDSLKEIRRETFGKRAAYAYSAGKDSIVLADLCEKAGISRGYFAYCDLDYPAFVAWVREHKPAGVVMMHTGYGLDWLYQHQNLIFAEGQLGQRWHQISQRGPFTSMFFDNHLDVLIVGHRRIDTVLADPGLAARSCPRLYPLQPPSAATDLRLERRLGAGDSRMAGAGVLQ